MEEKVFFSTEGLADYFGVSRRSVEKWRNQRLIPGAVQIGRIYRFRRVEVEKSILSGQCCYLSPDAVQLIKERMCSGAKQGLGGSGDFSENQFEHQKAVERIKCRAMTIKLIYEKKLTREPCAVCGETKVHAHHNNYDDPLDITWLCPDHHYQYHREKREQSKAERNESETILSAA